MNYTFLIKKTNTGYSAIIDDSSIPMAATGSDIEVLKDNIFATVKAWHEVKGIKESSLIVLREVKDYPIENIAKVTAEELQEAHDALELTFGMRAHILNAKQHGIAVEFAARYLAQKTEVNNRKYNLAIQTAAMLREQRNEALENVEKAQELLEATLALPDTIVTQEEITALKAHKEKVDQFLNPIKQ